LEPLVSILINNFNYGRFLDQAIQSALEQSYSNVEVIIVDDGSTDNSREVMLRYSDRVLPLFKSNGGQASAFNAACARSKGEWILFLDADDWFTPGKVQTVLSYVERFPSVGLVAHNLGYCDGDNRKLTFPGGVFYKDLKLTDETKRVRQGRLSTCLPATSGLAIRLDILSQILPIPEEIRITADNYIKIAALSLTPVLLIPDQLAVQRIHGGNSYTRSTHTDETRLEQCQIGAKIAFHLKQRFPYLSKLAWKQYGRVLFQLSTSESPNAKRILEQVRSDYSPFEYSPLCCFYILGAFMKCLVRNSLRTYQVQGRF
jgi:glycosyltransferase involved in cell wall biosynthesis